MDLRQYAISAAQHTDALIAQGKIEEAVRISGEATATVDAEWTKMFNTLKKGNGNNSVTPKECDDALVTGNFIAGKHLAALLAAGAPNEAYATAAMLLYRSTLANTTFIQLQQSLLDILCHQLEAALEIGQHLGYFSPESDPQDVDHFAHIISYIASMIYALYQIIGNARPDSSILEHAYELLQQMQEIGAIQSPEININGTNYSATDLPGILPDLLGRSKALGILEIDV